MYSRTRIIEGLSSDGVVKGLENPLTTLLGPAYLGYVHCGRGGIRERREDVSLSVRGALAEFSHAVGAGESLVSSW